MSATIINIIIQLIADPMGRWMAISKRGTNGNLDGLLTGGCTHAPAPGTPTARLALPYN
jgi:hypothetical protein